VSLRVDRVSGRSYFCGLLRCNSPWECPVCLPRIQQGRATELRELGERHRKAGGAVYLVTLTMPHDQGDYLKPLRRHVAGAWRSVINGAPWERWEKALGLLGHVRALEVTHGPNAWHPHLHVGLYTKKRIPARELVRFRTWLRARWSDRITRATPSGRRYRAPERRYGVRISEARTTTYLAKMGLTAQELASSSTKEGRAGHRTYLQILRDATLARDPDIRRQHVRLWREWAKAMRGARQLTYSAGLRNWQAAYGVLVLADADLPSLQEDLELLWSDDAHSRLVFTFDAADWSVLIGSPRSVQLRLLLLDVPSHPPAEWRDRCILLLRRALWWRPIKVHPNAKRAA